MADKFKATWVSHSSSSDFLQCPRLYYLHNVYKDPKSGRKISIVNPYMSLGIAVHNVLEGLAEFPAEERMKKPLLEIYDKEWEKVKGKKGGFTDLATEEEFYERGVEMIKRAQNNPEIFNDKIIRIKDDLPHYWLSEEDEIILCGKVDWIRYIEKDDSVHIIDFKTGLHKENDESLQLPIYTLIMKNCQKRATTGAFYWYLNVEDEMTEKELPDLKESHDKVLKIARAMKEAREKKEFKCPHDGCRGCEPYEKILRGEAEFVGVGAYNQDQYIIPVEDNGGGVIEF